MFGRNPRSMNLGLPGMPQGLFGSSYPGTPPIRATPEMEEEARRLEMQLDIPDTRQSSSSPTGTAVPPQQTGPMLGDMAGPEPQRPNGFWQGGKKFTVRGAVSGRA